MVNLPVCSDILYEAWKVCLISWQISWIFCLLYPRNTSCTFVIISGVVQDDWPEYFIIFNRFPAFFEMLTPLHLKLGYQKPVLAFDSFHFYWVKHNFMQLFYSLNRLVALRKTKLDKLIHKWYTSKQLAQICTTISAHLIYKFLEYLSPILYKPRKLNKCVPLIQHN